MFDAPSGRLVGPEGILTPGIAAIPEKIGAAGSGIGWGPARGCWRGRGAEYDAGQTAGAAEGAPRPGLAAGRRGSHGPRREEGPTRATPPAYPPASLALRRRPSRDRRARGRRRRRPAAPRPRRRPGRRSRSPTSSPAATSSPTSNSKGSTPTPTPGRSRPSIRSSTRRPAGPMLEDIAAQLIEQALTKSGEPLGQRQGGRHAAGARRPPRVRLRRRRQARRPQVGLHRPGPPRRLQEQGDSSRSSAGCSTRMYDPKVKPKLVDAAGHKIVVAKDRSGARPSAGGSRTAARRTS